LHGVRVAFADDRLVAAKPKGEGEGYWSRESSYGKFQRRLWLPEGAQLDQMKAGFDNGMLNVFIPLPGRQRVRPLP
jgi:HSP20 family molecular chaperone IbpA